MSTAAQIAQEYFPDASSDELSIILWEFTAYPFAPEQCLRQQLEQLAEVTTRYPGARLCFACTNLTIGDNWLCLGCAVEMSNQPLLNP